MKWKEVKVAGLKISPPDLSLEIDRDDLERELSVHATTWLYVAAKGEKLRMRREALELRLKRKEADLYEQVKSSSEKKPTEAAIKAAIVGDDDVASMEDEILEVKHQEREASLLREALWGRRECLLMIARMQMAEKSDSVGSPVRNVRAGAKRRSR